MSLKSTIDQDIKSAMKAKDQASLRTLRSIKSQILLAETAEGRGGEPLNAEEELKLLARQAKQRKDSWQQYKDNGRDELAQIEEEELRVIEKYLPQQLSSAEVEAEVKKIIAQVGATSMKDMGKVMGMASKAMSGRADGKAISQIVKQILS